MALSMTQLEAATEDFHMNTDPVDAYFTGNVLLYKLFKSGSEEKSYIAKTSELVDGGDKIQTFIEHDEANSGTYGNTTVINQAKKDIINAAKFRWAGFYASNTIDLKEQRNNSGAAQIVDLVWAKLRNIQKTIRKTMGAGIFAAAGTDTDAFIGLADLFSTVTATAYGEIAEDDMAIWKANVITTARAISFKVLQEIWRTPAMGQTRDQKPNLAITTESLKDGYEASLQTQQRFQDQKLVDAGFDNVLFKGAPIVADYNQTATYFDALNTNYLCIKAHKDYNFTMPKWIAKQENGQPDVLTANQRWSGQLVCSNRRAHVRHTNLTSPN